jgi:hypothetical protein
MELKDIFPKDPVVRGSDGLVAPRGGDVAEDDDVEPLYGKLWSYCCIWETDGDECEESNWEKEEIELRIGVLGREVFFDLGSQRITLAPESAGGKVCSRSSIGDANPVSKSNVALGMCLAVSFCKPFHASQLRRLGRTPISGMAKSTIAAEEGTVDVVVDMGRNKGWRLPEFQVIS